MAARPLMQHGVAQLEQLFAKSKSDSRVLKQLEHELQYRQVPRAVGLLAEVQGAIYLANPSKPSVSSPEAAASRNSQAEQPDLWAAARPPSAKAAEAPPAEEGSAKKLASQASPSRLVSLQVGVGEGMSIEEAYKVLKASPGATWESIEQTRRNSVQQAHPGRLAPMNEEKRAQIRTEAKRVNAAYGVLIRQRIGTS